MYQKGQTFACLALEKHFFPQMELPQNLFQTFACVESEKKTFFPKMEVQQNLWQVFACVASEKSVSPPNGVATKFMANVCLCKLRKNTSSQKWGCYKIYGKFYLCRIRKKTSSQKWGCYKIHGKFLPV